jgi:hypothetical protein
MFLKMLVITYNNTWHLNLEDHNPNILCFFFTHQNIHAWQGIEKVTYIPFSTLVNRTSVCSVCVDLVPNKSATVQNTPTLSPALLFPQHSFCVVTLLLALMLSILPSSSFPFPFVPLQRRGCLAAPLFL